MHSSNLIPFLLVAAELTFIIGIFASGLQLIAILIGGVSVSYFKSLPIGSD